MSVLQFEAIETDSDKLNWTRSLLERSRIVGCRRDRPQEEGEQVISRNERTDSVSPSPFRTALLHSVQLLNSLLG